MIALLAGGCGRASTATTPLAGATPGQGAAGLTWLLTAPALKDTTGAAQALAVLRQGHVYELGGSGTKSAASIDVIRTTEFADLATLTRSLQAKAPNRAHAVLYDPESWRRTPASDQEHLASAISSAGSAALRSHVTLLVSPGLDLAAGLDPGVIPSWRAYVALKLAVDVARAGSVLIVQAQSLERDASEFGRFVEEAAQQAYGARRGVVVLAGISTNPPGNPVSLTQLENAVAASRPYVNGYWLNIPSPGPACNTCGAPKPGLGVQLLEWLGRRPAHPPGT